jgi:hypothetical protein
MSQAKNSDSTTPSGTPAGSAASQSLRKFGRRELLRGGGVAALAIAGAAVVPFVATARTDHDAELIRLGGECLAAIPGVRRLERLSNAKYQRCVEGMPSGWGLSDECKAELRGETRAIENGTLPIRRER